MSNSPLVQYVKISPHRSERYETIKKITIHHMAGKLTVEECGDIFQHREASANYGIGVDGRIGELRAPDPHSHQRQGSRPPSSPSSVQTR